MANKKSKRVQFTFDERSLSTLEDMTIDTPEGTAIEVKHPVTGEIKQVIVPALQALPEPPKSDGSDLMEMFRGTLREHEWLCGQVWLLIKRRAQGDSVGFEKIMNRLQKFAIKNGPKISELAGGD